MKLELGLFGGFNINPSNVVVENMEIDNPSNISMTPTNTVVTTHTSKPIKTTNHKLAVGVSSKEKTINRQFSIVSTSESLLRQRLLGLTDDEYLGTIGYYCLNDDCHYKGIDAVPIIKYVLKHSLDSVGIPIDETYSKPIYVWFKPARVARDKTLAVPIIEKNKVTGKYDEKIIYSNTKPDIRSNPTNYMVGGKIESFGYRTNIKAQSLKLYPDKWYVEKPQKNNRGKLTLNEELEKLHSQARKQNGDLTTAKTQGGYVGAVKKTKSTIKSGGKTPHSFQTPLFNRSNGFNLDGFTGKVQLFLNLNDLVIYLLDYSTQDVIIRLGKINSFDTELYQWSYFTEVKDSIKSLLTAKINKLIQPRKSDGKGDINLPKLQILESLKKQEQQRQGELKHSPYAAFNLIRPKVGDVIKCNSANQTSKLRCQLHKDGIKYQLLDNRTIKIIE